MKTTKKITLVYMDGYDEVRDLESQEVVFSTKIDSELSEFVNRTKMDESVIDNVVNIWNKTKSIEKALFSGGELDEYLLNEGKCTQDEREEIVESLYEYVSPS